MNIDVKNNSNYAIDIELLKKISFEIFDQNIQIDLLITSSNEIKKINKKFRNIDRETDVLSFQYGDMINAPFGSIVVSYDLIEKKASEYGHDFNDELSLLYTHGLLHIKEYDHEIDNGEHRKEEARIIEMFKLPNSLLARNS